MSHLSGAFACILCSLCILKPYTNSTQSISLQHICQSNQLQFHWFGYYYKTALICIAWGTETTQNSANSASYPSFWCICDCQNWKAAMSHLSETPSGGCGSRIACLFPLSIVGRRTLTSILVPRKLLSVAHSLIVFENNVMYARMSWMYKGLFSSISHYRSFLHQQNYGISQPQYVALCNEINKTI